MKEKVRCKWCLSSEKMMKYHDEEWGVPVCNDRKWFEFIVLDGFQAGLSWSTIINKRDNFRKAFDKFNFNKIAKYDERKLNSLLNDAGIIRNRLKIYSSVSNAKAFITLRKEFSSFNNYIWKFTNGKTIHNKWKSHKEILATTKISDELSKDLRKRGFNFVGSTICYAFMQAAGMVNDHTTDCFRHKELLTSN